MSKSLNKSDYKAMYKLAEDIGFPPITPVSSLLSISHLFGTSKQRCGIYLLAFQSGLFYVGQAINVVRRFSQHRKVHDDIVGFSFIPKPKSQLDDAERQMIFRAESGGIMLTNAMHVTNVSGDTDLDLVVTKDHQEIWLREHARLTNIDNKSPKIVLPESQQLRYSKQFARFNKHPLSRDATALLRKYISSCIVTPRLTEYSFWAVSCMPGTNHNTWPRLFCMNAGMMELFVSGWSKDNPDTMWAFVIVAKDTLVTHWGSIDKVERAFPHLEISQSNYRDAGQHQIMLHTHNSKCMEKMLNDPGITVSAATLALRVMRKRATIYGKYHCPQLANLALFDKI